MFATYHLPMETMPISRGDFCSGFTPANRSRLSRWAASGSISAVKKCLKKRTRFSRQGNEDRGNICKINCGHNSLELNEGGSAFDLPSGGRLVHKISDRSPLGIDSVFNDDPIAMSQKDRKQEI